MTRQLILAAALLTGTAAFAQEAMPDTWMQAEATKTRAQVQAELAQARQDGTIRSWSAGYIEPVRSTLTRAEVRMATLQARDSGVLAAIDAEAPSPALLAAPATLMAANSR